MQVKRKELTTINRKLVHRKTTRFRKFLWKISLDTIDTKIKSLKKSNNLPHENIIKELSQVILALDTFLDISSQESENDRFCIKVYDAVHLENGQILRTSKEFQGKEWFSNVAVTPAEDQEQYSSDEGTWYGKVSNEISKNTKE